MNKLVIAIATSLTALVMSLHAQEAPPSTPNAEIVKKDTQETEAPAPQNNDSTVADCGCGGKNNDGSKKK